MVNAKREPPKVGTRTMPATRPYVVGEDMTGILISGVDRLNGSPKLGDMIANDPNRAPAPVQWLMVAGLFAPAE